MINKSAGVRNVFSSVHIERGRGFRCAELIHFGLQHFLPGAPMRRGGLSV